MHADQPLADRDDIVAIDEAHLDVDLGKFRLPIGPRVLIAEAPDDLEVLVHPAHHQDLFEKLRRLRQGVKGVPDQPAGHQEVPGPFGRALAEHGSLDLPEPVVVKVLTDESRHLVADLEPLLHLGPAQIDVAIDQPGLLVGLALPVGLEGRGPGHVEDLELVHDDLDLAGGQLGVLQPLAAGANRAAGERRPTRNGPSGRADGPPAEPPGRKPTASAPRGRADRRTPGFRDRDTTGPSRPERPFCRHLSIEARRSCLSS